MNRNVLIALGGALVVVLVLLSDAFFTVHQTQQALVLQFGNPVRVVKEPGLQVKLPFIQQVEYFERRVLGYDAPAVELILGDQRRLVVDTFARYRIDDPLSFRQTAGTEEAFVGRLAPIVISALRNVLGETSLIDLLSKDRTALMARIRELTNVQVTRFGVQVVDVRIKRADLPPENMEAVFRRMRAERLREANELRAQGDEIAQRIRARAEREARVLIAEAERDAEKLRGEGDAIAIETIAKVAEPAPEFFAFYRSLQAYRRALADGRTSYVISPNSEFFRFFGRLGLGREGAPATPPAPAAARPQAPPAATAEVPPAPPAGGGAPALLDGALPAGR